MPLNNFLEVDIFDVYGMEFMGTLPPSFINWYIIMVMDYVSK